MENPPVNQVWSSLERRSIPLHFPIGEPRRARDLHVQCAQPLRHLQVGLVKGGIAAWVRHEIQSMCGAVYRCKKSLLRKVAIKLSLQQSDLLQLCLQHIDFVQPLRSQQVDVMGQVSMRKVATTQSCLGWPQHRCGTCPEPLIPFYIPAPVTIAIAHHTPLFMRQQQTGMATVIE